MRPGKLSTLLKAVNEINQLESNLSLSVFCLKIHTLTSYFINKKKVVGADKLAAGKDKARSRTQVTPIRFLYIVRAKNLCCYCSI